MKIQADLMFMCRLLMSALRELFFFGVFKDLFMAENQRSCMGMCKFEVFSNNCIISGLFSCLIPSIVLCVCK